MGVKDLKGFWGSQKNQYIGGLPKKRKLGQFADLRGGLARKRGVVFLRWG